MKRVENKIAIVFGGGQTAGEAMGNGRAAPDKASRRIGYSVCPR